MTGTAPPLHLAVALDGTGRHPASWREPGARPAEVFTAGHWADLVGEAERGLLDFVTIEDSLGMPAEWTGEADDRTDRVRGRLDALLIAARVAPLSRHIGLVPTVVVTHTEPFHASTAVATLDYVSSGRAGVQVDVSGRVAEAALFGRRGPGFDEAALWEEAADYVEVLRRLWDSWEDGAVIRDVATGRFVDRERLHYIDFVGKHFSVRGPSITPRPPQGQPPVAAAVHGPGSPELVGRSADIGFVTPRDADHVRDIVTGIRAAEHTAGRGAEPVRLLGDVVVFLDDDPHAAATRKARLDERAGEPLRSDAAVFAGTAAQLADLALDWQRAGLAGLRLHPGTHAHDLPWITRELVPELQRRGAFRTGYGADTLRGLLGLPRPANRFARTRAAGGVR